MPNLILPKGAGNRERIELMALANPDELAAAAALLDMSETEALAFIEQHDAAISAERLRMQQVGGTLEIQARRFAVRALERFNADLDQLDTMEVADLLKHALRIIENEDRIKQNALARGAHSDYPVLHFHISSSTSKPAATVDVEAVEVHQ